VASASPGRGCCRVTSERTPAKSHSAARTAARHSPTSRTFELTSRRTRPTSRTCVVGAERRLRFEATCTSMRSHLACEVTVSTTATPISTTSSSTVVNARCHPSLGLPPCLGFHANSESASLACFFGHLFTNYVWRSGLHGHASDTGNPTAMRSHCPDIPYCEGQ